MATLYLDLGDAFTKGVVVDGDRRQRLRYPSVVARRLLDDDGSGDALVLDAGSVLRSDAYDPAEHSRIDSYPGGEELLEGAPPVAGARFAGWLATRLGADRQLLGTHPTDDNVDALARKALILLHKAPIDWTVDSLVVLVDVGPKAAVLASYATTSPRTVTLNVHSLDETESPAFRRVSMAFSVSTIDAAACAVAALPTELAPTRAGPALVVDIGYLRTKLAIAAGAECHLRPTIELGVSDCVRRILRDDQERGLIADEYAVIRALERSQDRIAIGDRRFDVRSTLAAATTSLVEELARRIERAALDHFQQRGDLVRTVAIFGGGAALVGGRLADTLRRADLGFEHVVVASEPSFALLEAAAA